MYSNKIHFAKYMFADIAVLQYYKIKLSRWLKSCERVHTYHVKRKDKHQYFNSKYLLYTYIYVYSQSLNTFM